MQSRDHGTGPGAPQGPRSAPPASTGNPLGELRNPGLPEREGPAPIAPQLEPRITRNEIATRSEVKDEPSRFRAVMSSIADNPSGIVDVVTSAVLATGVVLAAEVGGGFATAHGCGLAGAVGALGAFSFALNDRLSHNERITVTSPLANWGRGFLGALSNLKEGFDDDGLQVCLGALAAGFCASQPAGIFWKAGVAMGMIRALSTSTFVAAMGCGMSLLTFPVAATATLSNAIAKPLHQMARWASGK